MQTSHGVSLISNLFHLQVVSRVTNSNKGMEHKPSAEASSPSPPANCQESSRPPIQVSDPKEEDLAKPTSSSLPHIILPPQDEIWPSPTPPGNPLLANPDFIALKEFVAGTQEPAVSENENRLIS